MAVRVKKGELINDENVLRVIEHLEKGIPKKEACEMLNISYNATRLAKIIQEYHDRIALIAKQKKALRNKPLSQQDITYICEAYLNKEPLTDIADNIFRTTTVVKNVIKRFDIPLRSASNNYFNPIILESDILDDYESGDLVFSARYNCIAEVIIKVKPGIYRIYLQGKNEQYAYQPSEELADLRHIQHDLGIKPDWMPKDEIIALRVEAIKQAKKRKQPSK